MFRNVCNSVFSSEENYKLYFLDDGNKIIQIYRYNKNKIVHWIWLDIGQMCQ